MQKEQIDFARTYRHLEFNHKKNTLYFFAFVLPCLFIFLMNLKRITDFIAQLGLEVFDQALSGVHINVSQDQFSFLGKITYLTIPTTYPTFELVSMNMVIVLALILFLGTGRRKGKPLAIYLILNLMIHLINCIYFLFAAESFPYSISDYSSLYMKQQVGIWLTFMILCGLVTGFMGSKGYLYKVLTCLSVFIYSLVFGTVRYLLFLFLLYRFSIIYMALMFFVLGPLFDFLYLVAIYAVFSNKMEKMYDSRAGKGEWRWS